MPFDRAFVPFGPLAAVGHFRSAARFIDNQLAVQRKVLALQFVVGAVEQLKINLGILFPNARKRALHFDAVQLRINVARIVRRNIDPRQPPEPHIGQRHAPLQVAFAAPLHREPDHDPVDRRIARLDRPQSNRLPAIRHRERFRFFRLQHAAIRIAKVERDDRRAVFQPRVFQLGFKHIAEPRHHTNRRALHLGRRPIQINLQTFVPNRRRIFLNRDIHIMRQPRPGLAHPPIRPAVVIHIPVIAKRALKHRHRIRMPGLFRDNVH